MEEKFFLEKDRIPVFIGKEGFEKKALEKHFRAEIEVDSESGEVRVNSDDGLSRFIISNIIAAVNMGHNPQVASKLEDENYVIDTIDVKIKIRDHNRLKSVMGRIIGKEGSTRRAVEEITKCHVSVKDHYVSIIGPYENVHIVHEALDMLISGASHKSFYNYLERNRPIHGTGLL